MLALLTPGPMLAYVALLLHAPTSPRASLSTMQYAPAGGDQYAYRRDPDDRAPVDVDRVELLLAERADCRDARDYAGADAIRDQLMADFSVKILDRQSMWYVEGDRQRRGGGGGGGGAARDFGPNGHDYEFLAPSAEEADGGAVEGATPDDETMAAIHDLIARRLQAKFGRRFDEADQCKAQLEKIGVRLFDRDRAWRYKPVNMADFGALGHDYARAEDDEAALDDAALGSINEARGRSRTEPWGAGPWIRAGGDGRARPPLWLTGHSRHLRTCHLAALAPFRRYGWPSTAA